ncbi:MAG: hypothetical protein R3F19_23015 [Verrucomicrobiales bacterium]
MGLLFGLLITTTFAVFDTDLHIHLQPSGVYLFLSGWVMIVAAVVAEAVERFNINSPLTKLSKRVRRISMIVGIAFNTVAWTFFGTPPEQRSEETPTPSSQASLNLLSLALRNNNPRHQ